MTLPMQVIAGAASGLPVEFVRRLWQYRHRVFVERLGWPLDSQQGCEYDRFDRDDTVYVALVDEQQAILGCARLLPTTRPYLLAEIFPQLLHGAELPRDPQVWELSRFAAMDFSRRSATPLAQFSSSATARLMQESMQCARRLGAARLVTVSPLGIERLVRRLGLDARRAGPPLELGGQAMFACWIELNRRDGADS
jgi:acyl homoserine lactone synthase